MEWKIECQRWREEAEAFRWIPIEWLESKLIRREGAEFYLKEDQAKGKANRLAIAEWLIAEASEFESVRLLRCG